VLAVADLSKLELFQQQWLSKLNSGANAIFRFENHTPGMATPSSIADRFVSSLGYKAIGFNWELLDAFETASGPRSAFDEVSTAVGTDIANPNQIRLEPSQSRACAAQFLGAFDQSTRTVVSNRYDGLWNPIAGHAVEWGFVAFDDSQIALLLLTD